MAAGLLAFAATAALPAGRRDRLAGAFAAVRTDKPPALDPLLKDPAWDKAVVATGLQTVTTQKPSPFESRFMLLCDDANGYVGMTLRQAGAPVTATQSANDVGFGLEDFAGVGIDPTGNGGQVYFFMTIPRGTRYQQSTESARFAPPWTPVAMRTEEAGARCWSSPSRCCGVPTRRCRPGASTCAARWDDAMLVVVDARDRLRSWPFSPEDMRAESTHHAHALISALTGRIHLSHDPAGGTRASVALPVIPLQAQAPDGTSP